MRQEDWKGLVGENFSSLSSGMVSELHSGNVLFLFFDFWVLGFLLEISSLLSKRLWAYLTGVTLPPLLPESRGHLSWLFTGKICPLKYENGLTLLLW